MRSPDFVVWIPEVCTRFGGILLLMVSGLKDLQAQNKFAIKF
jgi:hypothetical protein